MPSHALPVKEVDIVLVEPRKGATPWPMAAFFFFLHSGLSSYNTATTCVRQPSSGQLLSCCCQACGEARRPPVKRLPSTLERKHT